MYNSKVKGGIPVFKEDNIKKILIAIGAVVTAAAAITGVIVLVKKLTAKNDEKKFYIECDCEDDEVLLDTPQEDASQEIA